MGGTGEGGTATFPDASHSFFSIVPTMRLILKVVSSLFLTMVRSYCNVITMTSFPYIIYADSDKKKKKKKEKAIER